MIHRNQGNFYNWNAATFNLSQSHDTATTSICPRGWTLPSAAEYDSGWVGGDYRGLYNVYGSDVTGAPVYLGYAGYYSANFAKGGSDGTYWESEQNSDQGLYMWVSASYIEPDAMEDEKSFRTSVRCIAR